MKNDYCCDPVLPRLLSHHMFLTSITDREWIHRRAVYLFYRNQRHMGRTAEVESGKATLIHTWALTRFGIHYLLRAMRFFLKNKILVNPAKMICFSTLNMDILEEFGQ